MSMVDTDIGPHVLYPLLIYAKPEKEDVTIVEVAEAVRLLRQELEAIAGEDFPDVTLDPENPEERYGDGPV